MGSLHWNIRNRIIIAVVAMVLVLLGFVTIFAPWRMGIEFRERMEVVGSSAAVVLASLGADSLAKGDAKALKEVATHELVAPDVTYVEFVGEDGNVVAAAGTRPPSVDGMPGSGPAVKHGEDVMLTQRAVVVDSRRVGLVRVAVSMGGLENRKALLRWTMGLVAGLVIAVAMIGGYLLHRWIARPISRLTDAVKAMEHGDLEASPLDIVEGDDEIGRLASALNRMREDLRASYEELARAAKQARRRADKLEQVNADLDKFAYAASHDLRAPLRGIAHLTEFLEDDLSDVAGTNESVQTNLKLLRQRVTRMDALLMSLLAYSRAGKSGVEIEDVNVRKLVEGVIDLVAPPDGFTVEAVGEFPYVDAPRSLLELVFVHLISNAITHHDKAEGRIVVSAVADLTYATFTVEDDGPGIPPELHKRVFDIFTTLKRRDEVEGSGMGLALIKKIVESARGTLTLESDGRGCRFRVRWPLEWKVETATNMSAVPPSRRSSTHV